jgi:hypothetical protein
LRRLPDNLNGPSAWHGCFRKQESKQFFFEKEPKNFFSLVSVPLWLISFHAVIGGGCVPGTGPGGGSSTGAGS